jgi:hypothetical protein
MNFIKAESFVLKRSALIAESANASLARIRTWCSAPYVSIVNVGKNVGQPNCVEIAEHFAAGWRKY